MGSLDSILDGLADRVVTTVSDLAPARASSAAGLSREQELEQQLHRVAELEALLLSAASAANGSRGARGALIRPGLGQAGELVVSA